MAQLQNMVDRLSDKLFNSYLNRCKTYQDLQTMLDNEDLVDVLIIEKLFTICTKDIIGNMKYSANAMSLLPKLLEKIKKLDKDTATLTLLQSAVPSAVAVIHMLKLLNISSTYSEALTLLSIEVLKMYPPDVISCVFEQHKDDVMELINMYTLGMIKKKGSEYANILPFNLIDLFLNVLPKKTKEDFVEEGLKKTFFMAISKLFSLTVTNLTYEECINTIEHVTECIVQYDYTNNENWMSQLENICNVNKYPALLKRLLQQHNEHWYRLWIILIKLLKNQITTVKLTTSNGSPINSLLPVVEMAYKMEPNVRCQAFLCWDALIDNFSSDMTESQVNKRIKLLIVPLKSSNAKVEETTLAKFNTWWRLIRKFHSKMDRLAEVILMPFLHFCFGRNHPNGKIVPSHGYFSEQNKKMAMEALVEIVGHNSCDGCSQYIPTLDGRIISTKMLVDHWNDWVYSLKGAIRIAAGNYCTVVHQQVSCLWLSLCMPIGELPENNIRKDLFMELLIVISDFLKECTTSPNLSEIVFDVLIMSLFIEENSLKQLLKSKSDPEEPINMIIQMVAKEPHLDKYFFQKEAKDLIQNVKPISHLILNNKYNSSEQIIESNLEELNPKTSSVALWVSLAEEICESKANMSDKTLQIVLFWPVKNAYHGTIDIFFSEVWSAWLTLYNFVPEKLKIAVYLNIIHLIFEANDSYTRFGIYVTVAVLKNQLVTDPNITTIGIEMLMEMLKTVNYKSIEKGLPLLIDTVVLMLHEVAESRFSSKQALTIVSFVLRLCPPVLMSKTNEVNIVLFLENMFRALEPIVKIQTEYQYLSPILEICVEYLTYSNNSMNKILTGILKNFVSYAHNIEQYKCLCDKIIDALEPNKPKEKIDSTYKTENNLNKDNQNIINDNFTTPNTMTSAKKKKREPRILHTVEENGEEFLVVKSNWKFNPRKLTENQKEKLKRKREDIPALYQDLSQSQDEFKLTTWKPDSQDTSSTSGGSRSVSKSGTEDVAIILKNMPCNEVVPTIMENILSEKTKDSAEASIVESLPTLSKTTPGKSNYKGQELNKIGKNVLSTKESKSPRLALKDRVFRNVRNLIEKSNLQDSNKPDVIASGDLNKTVNENTPKMKAATQTNNSAPSMLLSERPSRVKKVPKKFDDSEVTLMKKKRRSLSCSQSDESDPTSSENYSTDTNNLNTDIPMNEKAVTATAAITDTNNDLNVEVSEDISDNNCKPLIKTDECDSVEKEAEKVKNNSFLVNKGTSCQIVEYKDVDSNDTVKPDVKNNIIDTENIESTPKTRNTVIEKGITTLSISKNKKDTVKTKTSLKEDSNIETTKFTAHKESTYNEEDRKDTEMIECSTTNNESASKIINKVVETPTSMQGMSKIKKHTTKTVPTEKDDEKVVEAKKTNNNKQFTSNNREEKSVDLDTPEKINCLTKTPMNKNTDEITTDANIIVNDNTSTPKTKNSDETKSSKKKTSRIEKQLLIDMVEGHPLLQQTEKRATRKNIISPAEISRRKRSDLIEKLNRSKSDVKHTGCKKMKEKDKSPNSTKTKSVIVSDSEDILPQSSQEIPHSEDVIESSQDSSITTISTTSGKNISKNKVPIVKLDHIMKDLTKYKCQTNTQQLIEQFNNEIIPLSDTSNDEDSHDDIELSKNKTLEEEKKCNSMNLTENMDTQPIDDESIVIINDDPTPIEINSEDTHVGFQTQEIADADTQPMESEKFNVLSQSIDNDAENTVAENIQIPLLTVESSGTCSPLKDNIQKKKDFLNDTFEISPIKSMSPLPEKKSPSPENSSDYVVIKLNSPVQSNGEPYTKGDSPEIFTEDRISPEKREQSPPQTELIVNNSSPSSSLSLKKNRPQVRSGGRAAQMLGLCAPDKLKEIMNSERSADVDEAKKNLSTPVRRNLRILYNTASENIENLDEENDQFLQLKRSLPNTDCSPSGPILKRKLAEITDEATVSPASKRKRVSFHDPPVSTTVAVQKYIEAGVLRSPQSSALKRLEKQLRSSSNIKSPKRLDTAFKLDTVLTKTIESFVEEPKASIDETQLSVNSMDTTPVVEVVKCSDLNDTDPICPDLLNCNDPVDNIAGDLSSPGMKDLLIKKLQGKLKTIGDLAKMTELEVNRLCIKAPKVKIAKKVLDAYAAKIKMVVPNDTIDECLLDIPMTVQTGENISTDAEVQTVATVLVDIDMQTDLTPVLRASTQTEATSTLHCSVQTKESGLKSTKEIIESCLTERVDFIQQLGETLQSSSIEQLADKLPVEATLDSLMKKVTVNNSAHVLDRVVNYHSKLNTKDSNVEQNKLSFLRDYLCDSFNSKDLILFCSQLLHKVHDKPA